nr:hypothetical protein HUO10_005312 [Paraburkholderia busanensis]
MTRNPKELQQKGHPVEAEVLKVPAGAYRPGTGLRRLQETPPDGAWTFNNRALTRLDSSVPVLVSLRCSAAGLANPVSAMIGEHGMGSDIGRKTRTVLVHAPTLTSKFSAGRLVAPWWAGLLVFVRAMHQMYLLTIRRCATYDTSAGGPFNSTMLP